MYLAQGTGAEDLFGDTGTATGVNDSSPWWTTPWSWLHDTGPVPTDPTEVAAGDAMAQAISQWSFWERWTAGVKCGYFAPTMSLTEQAAALRQCAQGGGLAPSAPAPDGTPCKHPIPVYGCADDLFGMLTWVAIWGSRHRGASCGLGLAAMKFGELLLLVLAGVAIYTLREVAWLH